MTTALVAPVVGPQRPRQHVLAPHRTSPPVPMLPNSVAREGIGAGSTPVAVQHGLFDDLLGTAVPGLLGAASSFLGGDSESALGTLRETGAGAASSLVQQGAGALGGLVGGSAGEHISSLGAPVGEGLSGVISGESSPGEAAGGLLTQLQPMIMSLLSSLLRG